MYGLFPYPPRIPIPYIPPFSKPLITTTKYPISDQEKSTKFVPWIQEMAETLSEDQIAEFWEAFCMIDRDSDGCITVEELALMIQSLEGNPTKEEVRDMISEIHADENGTIDFDVFLSIMTRKLKENVTDELKEAFKVFDRDQDGFISASELRQVMINLGERLSVEEAQQMIREADLDGDGLVSYEEFARMMMAY